jgi:hypothetical protein
MHPAFANQPDFSFYFVIVAAGLLPWTGLVLDVSSTTSVRLSKAAPLDAVEMLLWIWTFVIVVFFASTFSSITTSAAPALCAVCAGMVRPADRASVAAARAWDFNSRRAARRRVGSPAATCRSRLELPAYAMAVPVTPTAAGVAFTGPLTARTTAAENAVDPVGGSCHLRLRRCVGNAFSAWIGGRSWTI